MNPTILGRTAILTFLALLGTGCVSSPWEQNYKPSTLIGNTPLKPTQQVSIRTVEFERAKAFLEDDAKRRAASAVALEDETGEMKRERQQRMLKAFRVPEKQEDVMLLGREEFCLYVRLDPKDGQLEAFAKKIGADYAAVSIGYMGRVNAVVYMPRTNYATSFGTSTAYGAGGSATAYSQDTTTATTYEPVQTTEPLFQYDVIYVRRMRPGDSVIPFPR